MIFEFSNVAGNPNVGDCPCPDCTLERYVEQIRYKICEAYVNGEKEISVTFENEKPETLNVLDEMEEFGIVIADEPNPKSPWYRRDNE